MSFHNTFTMIKINIYFRTDYQNNNLNDATAEENQELNFRVVTVDHENDMAQPRQARFDSSMTSGSKMDGGNRLWSTW